jgi:hypothetical protein
VSAQGFCGLKKSLGMTRQKTLQNRSRKKQSFFTPFHQENPPSVNEYEWKVSKGMSVNTATIIFVTNGADSSKALVTFY